MPVTHARKDFRNADLHGTEYADMVFDRCTFVSANLCECEFQTVRFVTCDLSLARLANTRMNGVTFEGCKFLNVDFRKCKGFLDMRFENCVFDSCNFSDLTLKQQAFVACELRRCTYIHTNLVAADFSHSDLSESLFHDCDLTRADFSRAKNYAIDPTGNKVAKAKFSLPEAVSLLRGFDIVLKE